ncbi:MAG: hypothetical protein C0507_12295 [Cyanobacteria bacterium PR.3.49]|nr:hypothetical protein [Cyanobacteria bacterium PR.3.49]
MQQLDDSLASTVFHKSISRFLRNAICISACLLIQPWYLAASADTTGGDLPLKGALPTEGALTPDTVQAADILGIRQEAEQIISLRGGGASSGSQRHQLNNYRALVLRKIFEADLQTQAAESRLEFEIAYTYDAIMRQQRKENTVNQIFNAANFTQSGVLGITATVSDLRSKFVAESTQSLVSGGVGTILPTLGILYGKVAKASHLTPPLFMSSYVNGRPVDGSDLPPLVMRYLDSPAPGESRTRREVLNAEWKKYHNADMAIKKTLAGIDDGKARSQGYLSNRLTLLWSLYTTIEGFNTDLLSLLKQVRGTATVDYSPSSTRIGSLPSLGKHADHAARLLRLEPVLAELNALNASGGDSERKRELQITLLETLVYGGLDMAVAADRCQKELNYQADVVLAQLSDRQSSVTQKIFEANFIQNGVFGATASYCYLKKFSNTGGEILLVAGGIGLLLTGASLLAMHGGWRKNETGPNSLADFFNLRPASDKGFSPLVMEYLNSPAPEKTDGKTRRQCLIESWTNRSVATVNLKDRRNLERLGSMPSCKHDSIKLVVNRIALLSSLRQQLNEFDVELLELLRKAWPVTIATNPPAVNPGLSPSANDTAALLGVHGLLPIDQQIDEDGKLLITRQVLEGFLSLITDADEVGHEIDAEFKALDRMVRLKNRVVQLTDNLNFLQGGILGQIANSLGLTGKKQYVRAANYTVITTSAISTGMAALSMVEQHGGWRPGKAKPNALGAAFGKYSESLDLSPVTIQYLNSVAPNSKLNLSRRETLIKYWKESKVLSIDISKDSEVQKLSAEGKAHHWWSETIKMVNNRLFMLYDLRAVMRSSNVGFYELLQAVD